MRKAVENLVHGRTVLVIAHRLSTVQVRQNLEWIYRVIMPWQRHFVIYGLLLASGLLGS